MRMLLVWFILSLLQELKAHPGLLLAQWQGYPSRSGTIESEDYLSRESFIMLSNFHEL